MPYEVIAVPSEGALPIKLWTGGVQVEEGAMEQLSNVARLPFVFRHIAVMPDVHWGMGATIGSVIPTVGALVPAAVGVDVGCGMSAVQTPLRREDLPTDLAELRGAIEKAVPHGRSNNGGAYDVGAWRNPPSGVIAAWEEILKEPFKGITEAHPAVRRGNALPHLGTLGTGNHFIEICLDEEGAVWVMLHSGSRGIGNKIGSYFIQLAKEEMRRWFIKLPDVNLAYFPQGTPLFDDYLRAVHWAQGFARVNRQLMMSAVLGVLGGPEALTTIDCHHNYVAKERHYGRDVWVTRKGAVRAQKDDLGLIPGSMGARSYVVRGLGERESFNSCSHGAGRAMSRAKARKAFSVEDHMKATEGVECAKDASVLDETPGAYKDIDAVMEAQKDLVEAIHTLKQIVCVKGESSK